MHRLVCTFAGALHGLPSFTCSPMVATIILGMLCVHLFCFCLMFVLISTRLHGKKMGMEVFALGNLLLGGAYTLQLLGGAHAAEAVSILNHTLTLCAPVVYVIGALRFFERAAPLWRPLLMLAVVYTAAQVLVQSTLGPAARHALLAGSCALLFLAMAAAALHSTRSFARDLRSEMLVFGLLIAGLSVLNAAKLVQVLRHGMPALDMSQPFQIAFYIYMSFLGTVLPPSIVWLVLRRLTDALRNTAARDPLTGILNRRGLMEGLEAYFRLRNAGTVHLLLMDIDHFKSINDNYGHKAGDMVLCHLAQTLQATARQGDLVCRLGGEEFVVACLDTDDNGALQLAERIRAAIAHNRVLTIGLHHPLLCTVTVGVSPAFRHIDALERSLQQADHALYCGKKAGRNRVADIR